MKARWERIADLEKENAKLRIEKSYLESAIENIVLVRTNKRCICIHCNSALAVNLSLSEARTILIAHAEKCEQNPLVKRIKELEGAIK